MQFDKLDILRAILLTVALTLFVSCNPTKWPGFKERAEREQQRITKETQEAINSSPELQELDRLCRKQIPLPADFALVKMHHDSRKKSFVGFGYHSITPYQNLKTLYKTYFTQQKWRQTAETDAGWGNSYIEFTNETHTVKIYHFGPGPGVNYSFHCARNLTGKP